MSDQDHRDLSVAFEELRAPRATADYADRVARIEATDTVYPHRWPQAVATVLAVVVAVAGAGTFLALRSARQAGTATTAGYPAARAGAAMAYDSTAGVTVMYGGMSTAGSPLADTWLWNGTGWAQSNGASPGRLVGIHMSDDPADGGVLLLGLLEPQVQNGSAGCAVGIPSTIVPGGSAGASPGGSDAPANPMPRSSSGSPAPAAAASPPGSSPVAPSVASPAPTAPPSPGVAPLPGVVPPSGPPDAVCPVAEPQISPMQTWLFTGNGWHRVGSTSDPSTRPDTPSLSQLAYDGATGQVVAVSSPSSGWTGYPACGPPLAAGSGQAQPAIVCPVAGSNGSSSSAPPLALSCVPQAPACGVPCRQAAVRSDGCPTFGGSLSTWSWFHGAWTERRGAIVPLTGASAVVFADSGSDHAMLVTQSIPTTACSVACPEPATVPAAQATASYSWTGTAWNSLATSSGANQGGPQLGGASVAAVKGQALVFTGDGQLWSWATGPRQWSRQTASGQPGGRTGVALAEGPSGSIVLFGGIGIAPVGSTGAVVAGGVPGADTWTWKGGVWQFVTGAVPSAAAIPSGCSDVRTYGNPCTNPTHLPVPLPQVTGAPLPQVTAGAPPLPSPPSGA